MSVLGIDIGTSYCVLATIQRGVVAVVRNDLSERLTPSLVGFTRKERLIGEAAQTQIRSNFRNTCRNMKQLLGCTRGQQEDIAVEEKFSLTPFDFAGEDEAGSVGYCVEYRNQAQLFTATRCMAALLAKLKQIAEKALNEPVYDVVIGVPGWYTDRSRQAMLDAAEIAGLNCLRTMNEHAAVALDYGIYRSNTFDAEKSSRVAFVGIGHGSTTVSVVEFVRGELRVLAVTADKTLGGRDMDMAIMKYFASQFAAQHKLDPLSNRKAALKLEEAATRAKKMLSANMEAPFNIECLIEDRDISALLKREDFEALCVPLQEQLLGVLQRTFSPDESQGGIPKDSIHHIELVGGCTRIPWVQKTLVEFFDNRLPLSRTLSMDEAVARGCALQAAMLTPRYRVREFNVIDRVFEGISVSWLTTGDVRQAEQSNGVPTGGAETQVKTSVLFDNKAQLNTKKWLTFNRSQNFEVRLTPGTSSAPLVTIVELPSEALIPTELPKRVKLKARLSLHGTVGWEAGHMILDEEVEEVVTEKRPVESPAGGDAPPAESEGGVAPQQQFQEVSVTKKKVRSKKFECHLRCLPRPGYLSAEAKQALAQSEVSMAKDDREQQETKEKLNELEAYIYDLRNKLSERLSEFASAAERTRAEQELSAAQDWVYDHLEAPKKEYIEKYQQLKALGDPIERRYTEYIQRGEATNAVLRLLEQCRAAAASPEYSHVDSARLGSLLSKADELQSWLQQVNAAQSAAPLYQDPTITVAQIEQEREAIINFSKTVLVPAASISAPEAASQQGAGPSDAGSDKRCSDEGAAASGDGSEDPMSSSSQQHPMDSTSTDNNDAPMN